MDVYQLSIRFLGKILDQAVNEKTLKIKCIIVESIHIRNINVGIEIHPKTTFWNITRNEFQYKLQRKFIIKTFILSHKKSVSKFDT